MANNLVFLQEQETDGLVSNFDLTNIFGKGYDEYRIFLKMIDASTNGGYIGIRVYDNSGTLVTGSEYQYGAQQFKDYASFDNTWQSTSADQMAPVLVGMNDDSRGGASLIRIFNADVAQYTFFTNESVSFMDSGMVGTRTSGCHMTAEIISGIRFASQSNTHKYKASIFGDE